MEKGEKRTVSERVWSTQGSFCCGCTEILKMIITIIAKEKMIPETLDLVTDKGQKTSPEGGKQTIFMEIK